MVGDFDTVDTGSGTDVVCGGGVVSGSVEKGAGVSKKYSRFEDALDSGAGLSDDTFVDEVGFGMDRKKVAVT